MRRVVLFLSLMSLAAMGLSSAWAAVFGTGPLVQVSGASLFAGCTADNVAAQPGTSVLHSEVEPWVDVNPTNSANIVGAWQQDRWSNGGARGLVAGVSFDSGANWQMVVIPSVTLCSGGTAANGGDFQRATDPWVSFAPNGHLYQVALSFDGTSPRNALLVSKSTDGGLTWSDPITVIRDTNPRFFNDKQAITADPTNSNFVYLVWDRLDIPLGAIFNPEKVFGLGFKGPAMFARTTNGGATWERARILYNPGGNNQTIGSQVVVLPDGTLANFFNEILNFRNDDGGFQFDFNLSLLRSIDRGAIWTPRGRPIRAAKMLPRTLFTPPPDFIGVYDPETGDAVRTEDVIPEVAADPRSGTSTLYAVWQDSRFSNNGNFSNPSLLIDEIAFSVSTDGGLTWSTPVKINKTLTPASAPLGNRQAFTPSVHVSSDGVVGVTYYDFRNNTAAADLKTDYWVIHCHPTPSPLACANPANWTDEIRLTNVSFDMRAAPLARGFFVGDYEGLAGRAEDFLTFFAITHDSDPASVFFRRVVAPAP